MEGRLLLFQGRKDCGESWYTQYDLEKNYANKDEQLKEVVGSSMIWGSQYDAVMNWLLTSETEKSKVTSPINEHEKTTTGGTPEDVMNNIFDLGGNYNEWTLERYNQFGRQLRAIQLYDESLPSSRFMGDSLTTTGCGIGRLTLYIK